MTQARGCGMPTKRHRLRRSAWTLGRFAARSDRLALTLAYPTEGEQVGTCPISRRTEPGKPGFLLLLFLIPFLSVSECYSVCGLDDIAATQVMAK